MTYTLAAACVIFLLSWASCCFGAEPIPSDVNQTPNYANPNQQAEQQRLIKLDQETRFGGKDRGDEGLKKLSDEFVVSKSPFGAFGDLIEGSIKFVWNLIQLIIVGIVLLVGYRAIP